MVEAREPAFEKIGVRCAFSYSITVPPEMIPKILLISFEDRQKVHHLLRGSSIKCLIDYLIEKSKYISCTLNFKICTYLIGVCMFTIFLRAFAFYMLIQEIKNLKMHQRIARKFFKALSNLVSHLVVSIYFSP